MFKIVALSAVLALAGIADEKNTRSKYAGEESRAFKSLSAADIEELKRGGGWGLAKPAELNGIPGPAHVLELQEELGLTAAQQQVISGIFDEMQRDAISLGQKLIALEADMETAFRNKTVTEETLRTALDEIAGVRSELRFTHLNAHLRLLPVMTAQQVDAYNEIRGYGSASCANPPAGHNLAMWRRHNGCETEGYDE